MEHFSETERSTYGLSREFWRHFELTSAQRQRERERESGRSLLAVRGIIRLTSNVRGTDKLPQFSQSSRRDVSFHARTLVFRAKIDHRGDVSISLQSLQRFDRRKLKQEPNKRNLTPGSILHAVPIHPSPPKCISQQQSFAKRRC